MNLFFIVDKDEVGHNGKFPLNLISRARVRHGHTNQWYFIGKMVARKIISIHKRFTIDSTISIECSSSLKRCASINIPKSIEQFNFVGILHELVKFDIRKSISVFSIFTQTMSRRIEKKNSSKL